jgi:hypothetical protein
MFLISKKYISSIYQKVQRGVTLVNRKYTRECLSRRRKENKKVINQ